MHSPVWHLFEKAFNQGDLAVVDKLLSPNHFAHNAFGGTLNGPQGLKVLIVMFRTAFPDLHCTVDNEIREGDQFAARWTLRGTHKGSFLDTPPTGRLVEAQGIIFGRLENGRISEDWTLFDQMGILRQLGVVPPTRG